VNVRRWPFERGFLLIPVVLALALIASIAFLLSREGAMRVREVASEAEADSARYLAQAGLHYEQWRADVSACTAYTDLPATAFGPGSYSASIEPDNGSPVNIAATGTLPSGASATVRAAQARVYDLPGTQVLQPNAAQGEDTDVLVEEPDDNHGDAEDLVTDSEQASNGPVHSLLRFDLSGLPPGTQVQSAELDLYLHSNSGSADVVEAHRVTRDWLEGTGAPNSGASWNRYNGFSLWGTPGGDYDPQAAASFVASGTGWKSLDLSDLAQAWVDGTYPNYGLILLSPPAAGNNEKEYRSSDSSTCAERPKLRVTYACECGQACDLLKACSADYHPTVQDASVSTPGALWGPAFMPECATLNGVAAPADGAWLLVDNATATLYMTNTAGANLSSLAAPITDPLGVARVGGGAYAGDFAVASGSAKKVYFVDGSGTVQGSLTTGGFTKHPVGVAYIGETADGVYEQRIAVSSDKDQSGSDNARVVIVDQFGTVEKTIDVSALTAQPWGLAHLPRTDKLLVGASTGQVYVIDFDGNLIDQYDASASFGVGNLRGLAINPNTCQHALDDAGSQALIYLSGS
jgi:hypothetical protein